MKRLMLVAAILLAGCCSPPTDRIVLCKDLSTSATLWQLAYTLKYHKIPVVISVHGGGKDHWTLYPDSGPPLDADSFVAGVVSSHPGRVVVVASCNAKAFTLHVKGALYPKNVLWSIPGKDRRVSERTLKAETWVGSIDEFVEGGR